MQILPACLLSKQPRLMCNDLALLEEALKKQLIV
jgi:hypothetical protein